MGDLILSQITKRFDEQTVLSGLDLTVPSGSFTAILGPSGVGKTTLLRLLAGFDRPDAGTITVGGRTVASHDVHLPPERRKIGYVPQEGSLFPHLTVAANVGFGLPRRERSGRTAELLDLVGLGGLQRRYPHQLSGGQQQRVALARALAISPEVVLLDEPFAALDANLRSDLRDEVRRILGHAGATTLLVTHNQDEALSSADLVAVLRDGRIVQQAPPAELYRRPVDADLAAFIGAANLIDGVIETEPRQPSDATPQTVMVKTALGRLPAHWRTIAAPATSSVVALVRPEQIRAQPVLTQGEHQVQTGCGRHDAPTYEDGATGQVVKSRFHGHDTVLHVRLSGTETTILIRSPGATTVGVGDACRLSAAGPALVWPREASYVRKSVRDETSPRRQ